MANNQKVFSMIETYRNTMRFAKDESVDYLTDTIKSVGGSFPIAEINDALVEIKNYEGALSNQISVVYDGGRHPEYDANPYSTLDSVFISKKGYLCLEIEDCDEYEIDRVESESIINIAEIVECTIGLLTRYILSFTCSTFKNVVNEYDDVNRFEVSNEEYMKLQTIDKKKLAMDLSNDFDKNGIDSNESCIEFIVDNFLPYMLGLAKNHRKALRWEFFR